MINHTAAAFVASNSRNIVSFLTENLDDNYHDFQVYIQQGQLDLIVLLDLYHYFIVPAEMNFLPEWLADVQIPLLAVDYFDLLHYEGEQLGFKDRTNHQATGLMPEQLMPLQLKPFLLKPCPPHAPEPNAPPGVYYWNSTLDFYQFVKPSTQELIYSSMQLEPTTKIISLVYDMSLVGRAMETGLMGFYFVVLEALGFYLRQFPDTQFQLLVVGFKPPLEENVPIPNLKVRFFTHLTEDIYQLVACGSDLLILNSNWSLLHADALLTKTPTLVLGNSIMQEVRDGTPQLTSFFKPHPVLYDMVELMAHLNAGSPMVPIFPFISYPIRQPDLPPVGLQTGFLPYHVVDIFDDEETKPILEKLLFDEAYLKSYGTGAEACLASLSQTEKLPSILSRLNIYADASA